MSRRVQTQVLPFRILKPLLKFLIFCILVAFEIENVTCENSLSLNSNTNSNEFSKQLNVSSVKSLPICIVGAGISGLNLAILLQQNGNKVNVFEKETKPGGKIVTHRQGNQVQVDMSPLIYAPWHDSLLKYIYKFGLTNVPFNDSDQEILEPQSGLPMANPFRTTEEITALRWYVEKYIQHRSNYAAQLDSDFGYANVSPDLFVSFVDWLKQRNLSPLQPVFRLLVTVLGYGALDEIPALYVLKFVNEHQIQEMASTEGSYWTLKEGLDVLALKISRKVRHLFFQKQVVRIERKRFQDTFFQNVEIEDGRSKKRDVIRCQKVILAFPPLLVTIQEMMPDLNKEEVDVFGSVRIQGYTSAAHHIPGLNRTFYTLMQPSGVGEVVAFIKQSTKMKPNVYSSYSWIRGEFNRSLSIDDHLLIQDKLTRSLAGLEGRGGMSQTFYREAAEYFPHVKRKSLEGGFYSKLKRIQGRGGLYYATTLLGFELMDTALKMTEAFVNKYF